MKAALAVALLCACTFDSTSGGSAGEIGQASTGGSTSGDDTEITSLSSTTVASAGASASSATTGGPVTTTDDGSASATSSAESGAPEEESGAPMVHPQSCNAILQADGTAPTGRYEIAPEEAKVPTPITVHCDMDTDGGGWTLVARSVAGDFDEGEFGWGSARGDILDPSQPYSLDAKSTGLKFSQVLVGKQGGGYAWGNRVYRFDVPPDFLKALNDDSMDTAALTTITGDCMGPNMLEHVGYTRETDVFWFRDASGFERFGLLHDRFDMYETNSFISPCGHGADLHDEAGMIMVR